MKNSTKVWLAAIIALFSFSQATAQLSCYSIQAPEKIIPGMQKVAVLNFEDLQTSNWSYWARTGTIDYSSILNDNMVMALLAEYRGVGTSTKVSLSGNKTRNYMDRIKTNVYTVVERGQLDKILQEQQLAASGAVTEGDAASVGKLLGLDVIVTGNFTYQTTLTDLSRTQIKDKDGNVTGYNYRAQKIAKTEANMKIISVETGQVYAFTKKNAEKKVTGSSTKGQSAARAATPSDQTVITDALKNLSYALVSYFTPVYKVENYDFKKPKVKEYKDEAKIARKAIKDGDLDVAYGVIKPLYDADNYEAALAHDLGILHEAVGNYEDAIKYYEAADQLEGKKRSEKVLKRAESGRDALNSLKEIGVVVERHEFDASEGAKETAERVQTSGKKKDRIKAYASADKSSKVEAMVPGATEFILLGREGDYVKIELLGGKEGYIHNDDIK